MAASIVPVSSSRILDQAADSSSLRPTEGPTADHNDRQHLVLLTGGPFSRFTSKVGSWLVQHDPSTISATSRLPPVKLSPGAFRAAWLALLLIQLTVVLYLLLFAFAYITLSHFALRNVRRIFGFLESGQLRALSAVNLLVTAIYVRNIGRVVGYSLQRRALAFPPCRPRSIGPSPGRWRLRRLLNFVWEIFFSRRGLFGIEHPYFQELLLLREAIETASQAYQSYHVSTYVPRRWLNLFSTSLLVCNCWSTSFTHWLLPKDPSRQRVLALAIDVTLDFAWAIVIPMIIVLTYLRQYDPAIGAFPERLQADNTWFMSWQMEAQQLLITSFLDLFSRLVPLSSILLTTRAISNTLQRSSLTTPSVTAPSTHIAPSPVLSNPTKSDPIPPPVIYTTHVLPSKFERFGSRAMFVFGVGVVVTQIHASLMARGIDQTACFVSVSPWFAGRAGYSCALAEINCNSIQKGTDRSPSLEERILAHLEIFDPAYMSYLVFTNCEALVVPPRIQQFRRLTSLEFFNSTIAQWSEAAALTAAHHPMLRRLGIILSNWSADAFPAGLSHEDLPPSLLVMNLIGTNLTTLPEELGARWRFLEYFNMEHGVLETFPPVIKQWKRLERLALTDNRLRKLPEMDADALFGILSLGRNPLERLPDQIGDLSRLSWLSFDHSNVSALPAWLSTGSNGLDAGAAIYGDHTPFCEGKHNQGFPCTVPNPRSHGNYAFGEELARRSQLIEAT